MTEASDCEQIHKHLLAAANILSHVTMCSECPLYATCAKIEHTVLCKLIRDSSAEADRYGKVLRSYQST